jgi:protein-disulfide isomerase-like protein with CxxC motif
VLNADAKIQYDTAKRFIRQADDALRAKNLVFAKEVAAKAAALAAQLGGGR